MLLLISLLACGSPEPELPTVSILAPADGATVTSGDVSVSIVVEHLTLTTEAVARAPALWSPIPAAWAHEGESEHAGTASIRLDGVEVAAITDTVTTLTGVTAGAHTLEVELLDDGTASFDPPVKAQAVFTAADP